MSFVSTWKRAIDVGAHVGLMAGDMLRFFDEVICFEPNPENFYCLRKNVPRVHAFPFALGAQKKTVGLWTPKEENSGAWQVVEGNQVKQYRLDDFQITDVGFIKIDVQGYELEVLKGARDTLLVNRPAVMVECYQDGVYNEEIEEFMRSVRARPFLRDKSDVIYVFKHVDNIDMELL